MTDLTPSRVDELAQEYLALKEKVLQAKLELQSLEEPLDKKKAELIQLVRDQGTAHRDKSWLLHGVSFEIMGTFGQTLATDSAAVNKFLEASKEELKPKQFAQIFEKVTNYRLLSSAAQFVRTAELSRKLKALNAACQVVKDKTPTLQVREKSA